MGSVFISGSSPSWKWWFSLLGHSHHLLQKRLHFAIQTKNNNDDDLHLSQKKKKKHTVFLCYIFSRHRPLKQSSYMSRQGVQFLETAVFWLCHNQFTLEGMNHILSSFFLEWIILKFLRICSLDVVNSHMDTVNCFCNARKSSNPSKSF